MSDIATRRRDALRAVVQQKGGVSKVSKLLGYSNPSFISQMVGPTPTREISEKTARKFEETLGLPLGILDGTEVEPAATEPAADSQADETAALIASVIRMVGKTLQSEGVSTTPEKLADVVALAYLDSVSHMGQVRETHVRQLARLIK